MKRSTAIGHCAHTTRYIWNNPTDNAALKNYNICIVFVYIDNEKNKIYHYSNVYVSLLFCEINR